MKSKVLNAVLIGIAGVTIAIGLIFVTISTNNFINDYQELEQDYHNLQTDFIEVKLERDSLVDQMWLDSQELMKEE